MRPPHAPAAAGWLALSALLAVATPATAADPPLPKAPAGWRVELVTQAPAVLFPTASVAAPDGTVYVGQDPMDMPGPPTRPIDSVVGIKGGKVTVFADKLWAVMGLEYADGTLYVVHPPFLSAFRDKDGDGRADERVDLVTGLGPKLPAFSGINDHVASGVRLAMDGFLYVSVGDKGIPRAVGRDGKAIRLFGGGVVRVRPDGTDLEVVSTGERNPLSVALTATDEVFTYGNDDDSKRWPNSLTHHVVGAHFGYPYEFLTAPDRCLPVTAGQIGGSGTQGVCYNEAGLPEAYRGNLFFCDWGLQTVFRYEVEPRGATYRVTRKEEFVTKGGVDDFRPFSLAVTPEGDGFYLVDWAYLGWLADGPKTGRLYRVTYQGADRPKPLPLPKADVERLSHPSRSVRLAAQRSLAGQGASAVPALTAVLRNTQAGPARWHALWALDAVNTPAAREAVRAAVDDPDAEVRLQAVRSTGIRRDGAATAALTPHLRDKSAAVRRETAVALGRLGDPAAAPALLAALDETDPFAAWSVRRALRDLQAWDTTPLVAALVDPARRDNALKLTDEVWAVPVVDALAQAVTRTDDPKAREKLVANLAGIYRKYPEWSGQWFGTNPLAGAFPQKTEPWDPQGMARVQAALTAALKDPAPAVRLQAIAGLLPVGNAAAPALRLALMTETDPRNLGALAGGLGILGDQAAIPALTGLVRNPSRPDAVRAAALDALGRFRARPALNARLTLAYDESAPAALVARALPALGQEGVLPPNDLAGFLDRKEPAVRAGALLALTAARAVPPEVKEAVLARIDDSDADVRRAAVRAALALRLKESVPRLVRAAQREETRSDATVALGLMPDPQALPVYLAAVQDRNPDLRRVGERALLSLGEAVRPDLEREAKSGRYSGPSALALERVLARFRPVTDWRIIGPFARTTAQVFVGEASIDFGRSHSGVEGRPISWSVRKAEPTTGRLVLDDFKMGAGDRGGFGYDTNGSPDLCAFAYAEIPSDRDRPALLQLGSSGSIVVTLNEQPVHSYRNFGGRSFSPDSDVVRVDLKAGTNRLLIQSRQGIGAWTVSAQVSEPNSVEVVSAKGKGASPEALKAFALSHQGDPKGGEAIFFDTKGVGCVKCHAAGGKGTATVGPDLTGLALKYDRAELIRSVLEPSARIATGYQPVIVALRDGRVLTGLVRSETADTLELVDAEAKATKVPKADIEDRKVGDVSVMPAGLADSLSVVEFADLVSYLASLKTAPTNAQPAAAAVPAGR